jgi:alanine racemase
MPNLVVSLHKIRNNVLKIKKIIEKKIFAVVKSNAYGLGMVKISKNIENIVDGFCVSNIDEAIELRKNSIDKEIILFQSTINDLDFMYEKQITMVLFSLNEIKDILLFVKKKPIKIHLKIDTGMGRLGILPCEIFNQIYIFQQLSPYIDGIMTHLSVTYNDNSQQFTKQI